MTSRIASSPLVAVPTIRNSLPSSSRSSVNTPALSSARTTVIVVITATALTGRNWSISVIKLVSFKDLTPVAKDLTPVASDRYLGKLTNDPTQSNRRNNSVFQSIFHEFRIIGYPQFFPDLEFVKPRRSV